MVKGVPVIKRKATEKLKKLKRKVAKAIKVQKADQRWMDARQKKFGI